MKQIIALLLFADLLPEKEDDFGGKDGGVLLKEYFRFKDLLLLLFINLYKNKVFMYYFFKTQEFKSINKTND